MISAEEIKHGPEKLEGLLEMITLRRGGQLQQLLSGMQSLLSFIPIFRQLVEPLHKFFKHVYDRVEKHT